MIYFLLFDSQMINTKTNSNFRLKKKIQQYIIITKMEKKKIFRCKSFMK